MMHIIAFIYPTSCSGGTAAVETSSGTECKCFPKHFCCLDLSKGLDRAPVCYGHVSDDICLLLLCPEALLCISLSYPRYRLKRL